jgi:hypothetical protein
LKTSKTVIFTYTLLLVLAFSIAATALPAGAQTTSVQTVILSNEYPGNALLILGNAGYYNYTIYQLLVQIVRESNPSLGNVLTSSFLQTLQNAPASSQVLTKQLKNYEDYNAIAISTDGTVQTVGYEGATYYNTQGTSSLDTQVSGIGSLRAVYTTNQTPLSTFTMGNTTYNVFAIIYKPTTATSTENPTSALTPTPSVPEFSPIAIVPLGLVLLFAAVIVKQKKPQAKL